LFLLLFGGLGITAGLWTCGAKLIVAMGEDITTITPCRGFCIELMSAFTVLGASALGIPVSTTHCKVGSIVAIGIYGKTGIPKKQIINIALAWFVTVPTSALLSAAITKLLLAIKPI
jgi:sodium-dependent phosphate transporter